MAKLLREFEKWLMKERNWGKGTVKELLHREWDGAYPGALLGEDVIMDIESFLHDMAYFAVQKVFGKGMDSDRRFLMLIVPYGSYEDCSGIYVLEMRTKTVLACLEEKTWRFNPELLEEDLRDLIEQLEEAKGLLAVRLASGS